MCLGKDFAFLQMKVTAAILLRFFKFDLVPGHKVQHRIMLTLHMSREGLRMNVVPRS
jgi:cytochrome P450